MERVYQICALVCILLLAASGVATAAALPAEQNVSVSKLKLRTSSGAVGAELYEAPSPAAKPAIVVLHGAGGTLFDGPEMRRVAQHLAENGNAVYVLHYFEATGTLFARDATMQKNFGTWLQTVRDSIAAVQELRGTNAPVGLYGYSLGGFLSLAAASDNPRVGAVVEHAGGVWNGKMDRIGKLPPVLVVHGRQDGRVPFARYAEPLLPVLRQRAANVQTRFFSAEAHVFTQPAMREVKKSAAQFFRRYLTAR